MQTARPRTLVTVDAATNGQVATLIGELSARRHTYQDIADRLHERFGIDVSRDMVRRWVMVDLEASRTEAAS